MLGLHVLNEINLCCIFIFYYTDHSIHGPFHSWTKVKLSRRTIPFTDHSIMDQNQTISMDHSIHGTFHSRTKFKLSPWTIPFTEHSIRGPNSNYLQGTFHSWTILFTDRSQTISMDHSIHGPFLSRTINKSKSHTYNSQTNIRYL